MDPVEWCDEFGVEPAKVRDDVVTYVTNEVAGLAEKAPVRLLRS